MRPLFHPSIHDITVEGILHALSDPVRAAIFSNITRSSGAPNCSTFLTVNETSIAKSTLSAHFKALREAGLIRGERHGTEMQNSSRWQEIEECFPGLIKAIVNAHYAQLQRRAQSSKSMRRKASVVAVK